MDFSQFKVLTFDCYGTLIDWESGILASLRPLVQKYGLSIKDEELLALYGELESASQSGPYRPYRVVLREVVQRFGRRLRFNPTEAEINSLVDGFGEWKPFPDTVSALLALRKKYRLVILSNVDDDLFALSAAQLSVTFDDVITAEQVGSYKPAHKNFEATLERIGEERESVLHVAQSLYHDIAPAKALGFSTAWVNRRKGQPGSGATLPTTARPDLEVPDLATLAELVHSQFSSKASFRY